MPELMEIRRTFNEFCRVTPPMWTADPVGDARSNDEYLDYIHSTHVIGECVCCGGEVCDYGDDYDFDGDYVCNECRLDYIDRFLIKEA